MQHIYIFEFFFFQISFPFSTSLSQRRPADWTRIMLLEPRNNAIAVKVVPTRKLVQTGWHTGSFHKTLYAAGGTGVGSASEARCAV